MYVCIVYVHIVAYYIIGRICEEPRLDAYTGDNDGQRQEILVNKPEEIPGVDAK